MLLFSPIALAFFRHALTFAGGLAVSGGWLDDQAFQSVAGALVTLGGVGWSVYDKRQRNG